MKIALFASGDGSNVQAVLDACQTDCMKAEPVLIVSDNPEAFVLTRAEKAGVPTFSARPKDLGGKEAFEREVLQTLRSYGAEWLVLAGYMRLLSPVLLVPFEKRIINIHPSLLPSFPGLDAVGQAFQAGVKITGVTIHFVDEGMDTGPIIEQEPVRIEKTDTYDTLSKKIKQIEHRLYPDVIRRVIEEE
ncbi:phosphoribosylglycinamide formyltransferase [Salisediminibacterium halotolerans]|uniref:phosphoribosylglycinamide formyltransferase n=1 Tax=Salisediminibacterium halotolerans TaxID=517425 RepID=UPI000EB518F3|nr:phosphoribosylglycinamide formyltransferase [Salisediminibacterium halotolerans]RLJ71767.1 phosphoribosylglycinamide formyltransferase-1 [Actinophytocola xinjiangensis]RPE86917.1 phosphoribosylglycinamide formyltransferase-1 [Salisediminibacterium halotolerans]TWG32980.1 phosphoribosylglycinamide formyltransferase-1 [Salisediminibacterium halotolerans]GEL08566.1 phosphoribosylglycinamide formyltransferase [Salisediminibacterium halotolerans]